MPLTPLRPLLEVSKTNSFAYGAFNVNAVSQAKAVIEVHEMYRTPAILQGADLANGFMGGRTDFLHATLEDKKVGARNIANAVQTLAKDATIPIVLHLDHGRDFESVKAAVDAGYTSVMIDGSQLPFEENVALTKEVVTYAHAVGVTVEGELGVLAGVEDHVVAAHSTYTNPLKAVEFVKRTGVDCLAISYGTMHGASKGADVTLRREIPLAISECLLHEGLFCALVSHGSSTVPHYIVDEINALGGTVQNTHGIPMHELQQAIACGINKINIDTDIRLAVTRNVRELFAKNPTLTRSDPLRKIADLLQQQPTQFDPRYFLTPIMDTLLYGTIETESVSLLVDCIERGVHEVVGTMIVEFGCVGTAPLIETVSLSEMADRYQTNDAGQ